MKRNKWLQGVRQARLWWMWGLGVFFGWTVVASATEPVSSRPSRVVLGWKEIVRLEGNGFRIDAKLDTGADNSSVHAENIEEFERNDQTWVRFVVVNEKGERKELEKPVVRMVRIRQHEGDADRRYVVKMTLSLGRLTKEVDVNLADRTRFDVPLLLGRSFLFPEILVDSGMSYTVN